MPTPTDDITNALLNFEHHHGANVPVMVHISHSPFYWPVRAATTLMGESNNKLVCVLEIDTHDADEVHLPPSDLLPISWRAPAALPVDPVSILTGDIHGDSWPPPGDFWPVSDEPSLEEMAEREEDDETLLPTPDADPEDSHIEDDGHLVDDLYQTESITDLVERIWVNGDLS